MPIDVVGATAGAIIAGGLGAGAKSGFDRFSSRYRYGHLYRAIREHPGLDIVVPSIPVAEIQIRDQRGILNDLIHRCPPNVLYMPMAEGTSLSRLVLAIRSLHRLGAVSLATSESYEDTGRPVICIGGPSGNDVSARFINRDIPSFTIDYPTATVVSIGSRTYSLVVNGAGEVVEDYGFILVTRTRPGGARVIVLFGIVAFGTEIAVQALIDLKSLDRDAISKLNDPMPRLLVARAHIDGLRVWGVEMIEDHPVEYFR